MDRLLMILVILFCLSFIAFSIWCLTWVDETWIQIVHVICVAAQAYFAGFLLSELVIGD